MAHQLVFSSESGNPRTYPVTGERISIGRHPKNTVVLDHEFVSIYHAEVALENGKALIRDLKSSNGTKVNRKRISEIALTEGDEIRFGPIICHFRGEVWFKECDDDPKGVPLKTDSAKKVSPGAMQKLPKADLHAEREAPLPLLEKLKRHLGETRYFMVSLLIHSVIVLLAGSIVFYNAVLEPPDFVAEGGNGLISSADDLPPPAETPADSVPTEKVFQQTPNATVPIVDVIKTSTTNSSFKVAMPQVQVKIMPSAASLVSAVGKMSKGLTGNLPGTMGGRVGTGRARAMALNGMKAKSEQAVMRGLIWLAEHQNPDGSWGEENKGAMTGFGLLCFLGHGELQDSPQFGTTVGMALTWVMENGKKNEGHLHMAQVFTATGVYEHAICAYALGEYYTMTRDRQVAELFAKAITFIIQGQGPGGGWSYAYDHSADDLSVSGWQIQALKAAHLSQIRIAGVNESLDKAIKYIERVRGPQGGYGYRASADDYSLTGVGILCQLFWRGDRVQLRKGMEWLLDRTAKDKPVKYSSVNADLYAWYYHTQACLMFGGDAWKKWNGWFQDEICDAQSLDGSWPSPGSVQVGPQNNDNITGAVYRSSLCILMLEVFYRYMPTTQG